MIGFCASSLPPTFAISWLIPRLASLQARDRLLSVQLTTAHDAMVLDLQKIDATVQWGARPERGLEACRPLGEILVPVCRPRCPTPRGGFTPAALAREVLMHSIQRPHDWPPWFDAAVVIAQALKCAMNFQNSSRSAWAPSRPRRLDRPARLGA
ncbi:LysR substrate-binding domain-containing protein [Elioraea rosea]|uniref:LysR substrate-binding domain-containing protein n=1 Tax=Elioraea rosea TaxID=2492390 RepID=UPI001EF5E334|nr:LysR substrate-binding domain-containing protein [Elioraea rosea]